MPPKTTIIEKSVVGLLRDPSPPKGRSPSRGRASATKRSPTPTVGKRVSSVSPSRKSFVRTVDEGPSAPVSTSEEFAPHAVALSRDWGKLVAIISLEVLFFLWLKWGSDIGLWAAIHKYVSSFIF